ncbi:MAG: family 10 glycosylhydrolase [Cyanobacteria bacterium J06581_3]
MQERTSISPSSISTLSTGCQDGPQAISCRPSRTSTWSLLYRGLCSGLLAATVGISGMGGAIASPLASSIAPSENPAGATVPQPTAPTQLARNNHSQGEVRSIWLDRETIVNARSPEGLAQIFEDFRAAGINTVFVETINAGYPIYPSEVAPEQNPLTRGWDPLQAAVDLGKVYDIEVHAWVWLFAVGNRAHNRLIGQPESYPGPVLSARPDWAGLDNQGNLTIPGKPKFFVDPANPEVRQYLFDILDEIATRYDVDGIQFDYVRYPFQDALNNRTFGYGTAARAQFYELTGVDPVNIPSRNGGDQRLARLWSQWTDFRAEQITSFVAEASQRLRRHRGLTVSAAVFAEDTYYRHHTLQQDWETWADQGLVDWIVLMSYARSTSEFSDMIRPWVLESSFRDTQVIPGIRLLNLPVSEAMSQIETLRDLPVGGYALFAADNLNGEVRSMLAGVNVDSGVAIASKQQ